MITPFLKYRIFSAILFLFLQIGTILFILSIPSSEMILQLEAVISGLFLAHWLIILYDMIKNPMKNKFLWIILMFVLPVLAMIVHIYRRKDNMIEKIRKVV